MRLHRANGPLAFQPAPLRFSPLWPQIWERLYARKLLWQALQGSHAAAVMGWLENSLASLHIAAAYQDAEKCFFGSHCHVHKVILGSTPKLTLRLSFYSVKQGSIASPMSAEEQQTALVFKPCQTPCQKFQAHAAHICP